MTLTSVNPLRVYLYDSEALLRFCAQDYLPFNASHLDSYVVGDNYAPIWEVSEGRVKGQTWSLEKSRRNR